MSRVEILKSAADNPKMREIYDILLMAGYFRIRIPSIKDFDKIMGGLTWSITCSNFDIDIEYNDDMKLGEKIKLSEKICTVLKEMECPHSLQPFQIQGLDSNSIFPVVQWLIKFVYETREMRQDFTKNMSNFVGKNVYKSFETKEKSQKQFIQTATDSYLRQHDKRQSKNSKIKKTDKKDPLRVYSTLIEFGDVTAYKTYNKMCAIMSGKISFEDKGGSQKIKNRLTQFEGNSQADQQNREVSSILFHGSTSGKEGKGQDAQEQEDFALDETQVGNFKDIATTGKIGEQLMELIDQKKINTALNEQQEAQEQDEDDPLNIAKLIQNEKQFHEGQVQAMNNKIISLEKELQDMSDELYQLKDKEENIETEHKKHLDLYQQLSDSQNNIQAKIDDIESKNKGISEDIKKAEQLVDKKAELEERKKQLRRDIKYQQEELERERETVQKQIPSTEDNDDYIIQLYQDVQEKKERYEEKFKQLAELNQQIAVLQRKLEGVPSPTEIAQYHQRLQELFENINQENLKYKDKFIKYNAGTDINNMLQQFVEIMRTFKENFNINRKSKSGRENFISELGDTRRQMLGNLEKSIEFLKKQIKNRDEKLTSLYQFQNQEREYFSLLKDLRMEFEKSDELQDQMQVAYQQIQNNQQQQQSY